MENTFLLVRRLSEIFGAAYGTEDFSLFLYSLAKMERPKSLFELGTGYAVSTMWLALALEENGFGHLWSIDDGRDFAAAKIESLFNEVGERVLSAPFTAMNDDYTYGNYVQSLADSLGLSSRVTFISATLDETNILEVLSAHTKALQQPIDLLFSDYMSSAPGLYLLLGALLPYLSKRANVFLDSVSTRFDTYLALERLISQLNQQRLPSSFQEHYSSEHCELIRGVLASHELKLLHIVESKRRPQNSTAWIKLEPIDLIPFSHDLLSW